MEAIKNIYDFKIKAQDRKEMSLSNYKWKVLLIVYTATECEFIPQSNELQDLYKLQQKNRIEIFDFLCNYGEQVLGSDKGIHSFCTDGMSSPSCSLLRLM